jgi:hypothetical protein
VTDRINTLPCPNTGQEEEEKEEEEKKKDGERG